MTQRQHLSIASARRYIYVLALLAIVTIAWCAVYHRWTPSAWATPISYEGDSLSGYAVAHALQNGEILPILPKFPSSLGAPFAANWNDFPSAEEGILVWWDVLVRVFGLFSGSNIVLLSAHLFAASSFYFVCRYLRYTEPFAVVGAALFSLSRYSFVRGFPHLTLTFYWHLPLGILVAWWCVARAPVTRTWKRVFCILVAIAFGSQSPYYGWLFCQFLALAAVICFLRGRRSRALWPIFLAAVVFATFVVMNLDTFYFRLTEGPNPGAISSRSFADLERYALKPLELVIPLSHRISAIGTWSAKNYLNRALFLGEIGAPYLGAVGVGALLLLLIRTAQGMARRLSNQVPSHFWSILWILAYSVVGGVGSLLGMAGLILFRCTNRYSIVILAFALLFAVKEATSLTRRWSWTGKILLASLITALALFDQLPTFWSAADVLSQGKRMLADRNLVLSIERKLPPRSMIFQLPVVEFPEAPPIEQMADYEQFRPYLHSRTLRFSYGSDKGRYRERWEKEAEQIGVPGLVTILERYGFSSLLINKFAYKDNAAALVESLQRADRGVILAESNEFLCVALRPSSQSLAPPEFDWAWYQLEGTMDDNRRWSAGNAKITFYNLAKTARPLHVTFGIVTPVPRRIQVSMTGRRVYEADLYPDKTAMPVDFTVSLLPGKNELYYTTDIPGQIPASGDPRKLAFAISNFIALPSETP